MISKDKRGRWTIRIEPDKYMGDYLGMNHQAGIALHYKHTPPPRTIYIDKIMSKHDREKTIVHEKVEEYMMRVKHLPYKRAHRVANAFEKHAHVKD